MIEEHIKTFGFEELPWLARECRRLVPIDADFVEAVYTSVFSYTELSRAETSMGSGRILSLTSTRKQDFDGARYELAERFQEFMTSAPAHATRSLIRALTHYVQEEHKDSVTVPPSSPFAFCGRMVSIKSDFSSLWDQSEARSDTHQIRMLDQFSKRLEQLGTRSETPPECLELLQLLAKECSLAAIWRRLLLIGARNPASFGIILFPLGHSVSILINFDTSVAAGAYLKSAFPFMPPETREQVERTILSIPATFPPEKLEASERIRNRLLGCLALDAMVTPEAKQLAEQLTKAKKIPPNRPTVTIGPITGKPYKEEDWLRDQGVPVEEEQNQRIRSLEEPVRQFTEKYLNASPHQEAIEGIYEKMTALESALTAAQAQGVHALQSEYAFRTLLSASVRIARSPAVNSAPKVTQLALKLLLGASKHPLPEYDAASAARFDESPSWGVEPRIEAAAGLISFCKYPEFLGPALAAAKELATDRVPAVRFQIATGLLSLYQTAPEEMWRLLEDFTTRDVSAGVLQGLVGSVIGPMCGPYLDRIFKLIEDLLARTDIDPKWEKVRTACLDLVAGAYIWRNHEGARARLDLVLAQLSVAPRDVQSCIQSIRDPISVAPKRPPREGYSEVRSRAFGFLLEILVRTRKAIREILARYSNRPNDSWTLEDKTIGRTLAQLADGIGSDLYFASGAGENSIHSQMPETPLSEKHALFYREAEPLLDELAAIAIPSITHHLLQMLEPYIDLDPKGIFLRIVMTVKAGQEGGYQYESLALELTVKLVEQFLADYRQLLRDDEECRNGLLELLEVFVRAGWPAARRLTYRLQEIFR